MDQDFASAPREMEPHGASSSHSHLLGRSARPSRLPGGVPPLIPVLRKTICLDAFPQSHIPQASSRPGFGAKARSVVPQETGIAPGNSTIPRRLSSISLTIRQNSQAWLQEPPLPHWDQVPTPDRDVATQGRGGLPTPGSPPMTLAPRGRVHSQSPGSSGLAKPSRMPTMGKHLVSSHLALPFQSQLTQSPPGPAGPGPVGQGHPIPMAAHMPTKASPGRGKPRPRGIPRSRLHLQRATPTLGPAMSMDLATMNTTKPGLARHLATKAINRPSLAINMDPPNTARLDIGTHTEFPALEIKLDTVMGLATERIAKSRETMNLVTAGTTKPNTAINFTTVGKTKLGTPKTTAGTAKQNMTTRTTAMGLASPDPVKLGSSMNMAAVGTAMLDTAMGLARTNTAKLGIPMESPVLDTNKLEIAMDSVTLVRPDSAIGGPILDSVIHLATSDIATYPLMPSRITDLDPDHTTADAATDPTTEPVLLGLAGQPTGLPETRTDAAMSELVPEPRPKPAVPMKPVSINSNLLGYIGIDTIIEQMRKKTMKTGFDFNIMVVGQSGLGKSTLLNTLFKSQVSRKAASWNREEKIPKTVEIKAIGHVIEEGGVKMKLTVIDTPGFGDQINNENCWEPIEKYINEQYEKFLKEEVNIARKKRIPDTRVHCCLYFISPTGHSLRPLDLEFMKHLSKVVNIVPVIAKADTMTLEEKSEFKQRVRKELEVNGIEFYPQKEFDEDLEDKTENDKIRQESMPFAVVGSDKEYQVNGKRVLGRKTPWGIIEVENLNHCEFALLRDFVIRTHLQDLKEVTHNIHYETYRAKRLNDNGGLPPGEGLLGNVLPPVPATPCPTAE
ncbi:neuronal-specific septin-3 [Orycteropus afer afer]|uniref:Neuronal-specific septin-3 n=1 Tax=Orycteropus afer afer TaxID=1230840 RepID=A0AC54Z2J2_ORYAF|nr:neuronal-specific septin-3 [Orycteropus afer afer]